jgi:hypothetical protein
LNQTLNQLRREFKDSEELRKADRDESVKQIDKLMVSVSKEETPGRLQKIKKRFDSLVGVASTTAQLIKVAAPLIEDAKQLLPHIKW